MALVRCTCLTRLQAGEGGEHGPRLLVDVVDPECGYVVHRMADDVPVEQAS